MRVLLPPSETKRSGGGSVFSWGALSFDEALGETRRTVANALERLSADPVAAAKALKLGARSVGELTHNLQLASAPGMPAIERFTGVLFDALDVATLEAGARGWIDGHVLVQSALFGLVAASDDIPQYRLSASSSLKEAPLKASWKAAHRAIDWESFGWTLDLRSHDYAALAPVPEKLGSALAVAQRGEHGQVRALNHFNKAAKGDLVRRLAISRAQLTGTKDFCEWADSEGLEVIVAEQTLTLITELGAPALQSR